MSLPVPPASATNFQAAPEIDEQAFAPLFRVQVAASDEQRRQAFALRYRVYCEELSGFESKERFPDGMERNATDEHSVHVLITRREGGQPIATARLVLTDPSDPTRSLPFEEACRDTLDPWAVPQDEDLRRRIGEVSRVAILGALRYRDQTQSAQERAALPAVFLTLSLTCLALSQLAGLESIYGLMEERFADLCRGYGMVTMPIGSAVSFHGKRTPYLVWSAACAERYSGLAAIAEAAAADAAPLLPLLRAHRQHEP